MVLWVQGGQKFLINILKSETIASNFWNLEGFGQKSTFL